MILPVEFQAAFQDFMAMGDGRPTYGIEVTGYTGPTRTAEVRLTFLAGHSYCCAEPGCHVGLHSLENWRRLRDCLAKRLLPAPADPLVVRIEGVVEAGVRLADLLTCVPRETTGYSYEALFDEAKAR